MFSMSMRYPHWIEYQQEDQSRSGIRDVMVRTTDEGKIWSDPTVVHQHAAETDYAVDPNDPDHILAVTRKQRKFLQGETRQQVEKQVGLGGTRFTGTEWPYKGVLILDSTDGGRNFQQRRHVLDSPKSCAHTWGAQPSGLEFISVVLIPIRDETAGTKFAQPWDDQVATRSEAVNGVLFFLPSRRSTGRSKGRKTLQTPK